MKTTITLTVETDTEFDLVPVELLQSENILSYLTANKVAIDSAYITQIESNRVRKNKKYKGEFYLEVKSEHVGKSLPVLGIILDNDVGKWIFKNNGIYSVENNEQRDKRLGKK